MDAMRAYLDRFRAAAPTGAMLEPLARSAARKGAAMSARAGRSAALDVRVSPQRVTISARGPGAGLALSEARKALRDAPAVLREQVVKAVTRH